MSKKLKHYQNQADAMQSIFSDYLDYLKDSLDRMETYDRKFYTANDRKEFKKKIHDTEILESCFSWPPDNDGEIFINPL